MLKRRGVSRCFSGSVWWRGRQDGCNYLLEKWTLKNERHKRTLAPNVIKLRVFACVIASSPNPFSKGEGEQCIANFLFSTLNLMTLRLRQSRGNYPNPIVKLIILQVQRIVHNP